MKNGCQKYLDTVPSRTDFLLFSSTFLTYSHRYTRMYLMYLECAIPVQQYDHYCTVHTVLSTQTPLLMISIVQNKLQNNKSIDIYSLIAFKVFFHLLNPHTPYAALFKVSEPRDCRPPDFLNSNLSHCQLVWFGYFSNLVLAALGLVVAVSPKAESLAKQMVARSSGAGATSATQWQCSVSTFWRNIFFIFYQIKTDRKEKFSEKLPLALL